MKSTAAHAHSYSEFLPFPTGTEKFITNHAKKMGLIAMSCVAIALAGILTRASFAVGDHPDPSALTIPNAPMAQPLEPVRGESVLTPPLTSPTAASVKAMGRELRFARNQLHLYSTLLESLQIRMNEEPSVDHLTRMRAALAALGETITESRASLASYETRQDPFTEEDLRSQLFAMQDSGQKAVSVFIDADNFPNDEALQVFNVSRTGQ